MDPRSLFSLNDHLEHLSKDGDPLEVLASTVDFEYFRTWLVGAWAMATARKVVGLLLTLRRCSRSWFCRRSTI